MCVRVGGGFLTWGMTGKRIAFNSQAAWAEYAIVDALKAIALPDNVDDEVGACALVNPLTGTERGSDK